MSIYGHGTYISEETSDGDNRTLRAELATTRAELATARTELGARRPIIAVWAEERGSLTEGAYEFFFGANVNNRQFGFVMPVSGSVFRMSLCSVKYRGQGTDEVTVNLVLNGEEQNAGVTMIKGARTAFDIFDTPIEVSAGTCINFFAKMSEATATSNVVGCLIELDL